MKLDDLLLQLQNHLWNSESRAYLQSKGINISPSNYYSTIPTIGEVRDSFEYSEFAPYLDNEIFDRDSMRQELLSLIEYTKDFDPAIDGNELECSEYYWRNGQFSYSDAASYHAFIKKYKPKRIVEIGSGFSSLVALGAIKQNEFGELVCIEPYPRPFLSDLDNKDELQLIKLPAQKVTVEKLNDLLTDGDILFIDSTHTVKSGSDCLHIYLRLIPKIRKRIFIHVHDIFLPFALPMDWAISHQIYWTEQYILLALLINNKKAKTLFGSAYHKEFNSELLEIFMQGRYQSGGGSFWFEYDGR